MSDYAEIDPFWVEQREQFLAAKSTSADPSACGTCRNNAEAGNPVVHDECQQRATLLHAPDHPYYELLAGFSLEENAKLPARFHVPVFDDLGKPSLWLCAVCWEDGTNVQWPCKTAMEHGEQVFSPQHEADMAHRKQQTESAGLKDAIAKAVVTLRELQAAEPDHTKAAALYEVEMGLRLAAGIQDEVAA